MKLFDGRVEKPDARLRLFAFPCGGGSASIFRDWTDLFPSSVEVCPIQLPGRETRLQEKPCVRMRPLIQELATGLEDHLHLPFVLFGHSMGALVAFELGRCLEQRHHQLLHIFISSCRAPHAMPRGLARHRLGDNELITEMGRLGAPAEILESKEMMDYLSPIMRADFELVDTYLLEAKEPLHCGISAFVGAEDPEVSISDLEDWKEHTLGRFRTKIFSGGHFYFLQNSQALTNAIRFDLAELAASTLASGL